MATPTAEEITRVHGLAEQIGHRLGSDAAFQAQYRADPLGTLTGQGLPADAAHALLAQAAKAKGEDEVAGYDDDGSNYYARDGFHDEIVAAY